jgi:hypothetical protein
VEGGTWNPPQLREVVNKAEPSVIANGPRRIPNICVAAALLYFYFTYFYSTRAAYALQKVSLQVGGEKIAAAAEDTNNIYSQKPVHASG